MRFSLALVLTLLLAALLSPASATAARQLRIGDGGTPRVAMDSRPNGSGYAVIAYNRSDGTVAVCRLPASAGSCASTASIPVPLDPAAGFRNLGRPGVHVNRERVRVLVADYAAGRTYLAVSSDGGRTFAAPTVVYGAALASSTAQPLFESGGSSAIVPQQQSNLATPDANLIARMRLDGSQATTTATAGLRVPTGLQPTFAVTRVTGSEPIAISSGGHSDDDPSPFLYEFRLHDGGDPSSSAGWARGVRFAQGDLPRLTLARSGTQFLMARGVTNGKPYLMRFTSSGRTRRGLRSFDPDFSRGRIGFTTPELAATHRDELVALWFAGKGQALTLGVVHSKDGARTWRGKRALTASSAAEDSLSAATHDNGSGVAAWQSGSRIKAVRFPALGG